MKVQNEVRQKFSLDRLEIKFPLSFRRASDFHYAKNIKFPVQTIPRLIETSFARFRT